jgi:hypothetical protein
MALGSLRACSPQSAMMLIGFCGLGFAFRSRRKVSFA